MIRGCLREQQGKLRDEDAAALKDMCMKVFFFFFFCKEIHGASESNTICHVLQNAFWGLLGTFGNFWGRNFEMLAITFVCRGDFRGFSCISLFFCVSFFVSKISSLITSHFVFRASQLICFSTRRQKRQRALHPTTRGLLLTVKVSQRCQTECFCFCF